MSDWHIRFHGHYERAEDGSCWNWRSSRSAAGYGRFMLNGKARIASRLAYEIASGPIPTGASVLHRLKRPRHRKLSRLNSVFLNPMSARSKMAVTGEWQPIETAPKDGTQVLAFGNAYQELAARHSWFAADTNKPRVPYTMLIHWVEGWYDKEIDNGDGTYRKERTQGYAYWGPEPHAFQPTHWMPLPSPPNQRRR